MVAVIRVVLAPAKAGSMILLHHMNPALKCWAKFNRPLRGLS